MTLKKFQKLINNLKGWIVNNKLEFFILLAILLLGAFLRLYRIGEYMTFLGDEGRDVIIVRRLIAHGDLILIGPGTSIGNMYLGPLYYYMMAPALLLANFSPVGPTVMVALLGIATVLLVWLIAREWFGKTAAIVASVLYASAPVVITYSRSSWNPNIMPFFALICIYSIWRVWKHKEHAWLLVLGISLAFVLQSHYLGLLLIPTLGIFWLLSLLNIRFKTPEFKKFLKKSIFAGMIFMLLMSPLVIFDARHGWRNFDAIRVFFTERQTTVSARPWSAIPKLPEIGSTTLSSLMGARNENLGNMAMIVYMLFSFTLLASLLTKFIFKRDGEKTERKSAYLLLVVWILFAFIGFGIYKQHIYDHYFGFFFPAPFLLFGGLMQSILNKNKVIGTVVTVISVSYLLLVNINDNPLKYPPNRQLQRAEAVAGKIVDEAGGEKVNLAVLAERNYEDGYQYFLERWSTPFVKIDPQRLEETVAEQLFVVCEMPKEKCNPVNNPKAEVANFGWSRIDGEWDVAGVTLYKLVHAK